MELKQILEELNKEYSKHCKRFQDRATTSFFYDNKFLVDFHISLLEGNEKEKYIKIILNLITKESKRIEIAIGDRESQYPYFERNILRNRLLHKNIFKEYETELQKAIEEGKQEAPNKPQEQAKEAPKGKATAKVTAVNEVDVNRIYQAMAKAGIIEEEPTAKRLIELHFEGLSENNIRAKNQQAKTDKSKNPNQLNRFIMELIKMIYDKTNIQHLENLSSEIDDYIENLENTYSKYS